MVRLVKKLVRSNGERILSLVVLPAFFLATLPQVACICADGQRRPHCNLMACCAAKAAKRSSGSCGCSCCKVSPGESHSCCKAKQKQPVEQSPDTFPILFAKTGGCCNPYLEAAAPAVLVDKVTASAQPDIATTCAVTQVLSELNSAYVVNRAFDYHGPPPRDAVIVYQHLTI